MGVARSTSPMRRMQTTRTRRMSVAIQALHGADAIRMHDLVQAALVLRERAAVVLAMPEVEHRRGEARGLVAQAGAIEPDHQVRVLEPPARETFIDAVHLHEVVAPERKVARLDAFPVLRHVLAESTVG